MRPMRFNDGCTYVVTRVSGCCKRIDLPLCTCAMRHSHFTYIKAVRPCSGNEALIRCTSSQCSGILDAALQPCPLLLNKESMRMQG